MGYAVHKDPRQVVISTPELELGFSRESGALIVLSRPGGQNYLGHAAGASSLDIRLAGGWMSQRSFARYLSHQVVHEGGATLIRVRVGIGALLVQDCYRVTGTLVARSVSVKNVGLDELQVLSIWMALPSARVGAHESCNFEAPANGCRPRLDLATAAQLRRGELPPPAIVPVARRGRAFESTPDRGPGLLALHATGEEESLLCWYFSDRQPAWPDVEGAAEGTALTMGHELELAGWLPTDAELSGGTQYLMVVRGTWHQAMEAFHRTWPIVGLRSVQDVPDWVGDAAIYELHPGLYGGFRGLAAALPGLRDLGVNVLHLMPVQAYDNRSGAPWDGNWISSGSPYAIMDFEQFDPSLGDEEDFRALVGEAHRLGLRVLLDFAVQGCARNARYVRENPRWLCRDDRGRLVSSHGWTDTWSFDWANEEYQEYMLSWALRLVEEFDIDGFRVDAPHHKEPNWDRALERPAYETTFGILRLVERLRAGMRQRKPDAALLCELYGPVYHATHDFSADLLPHLMFYQAALGRLSPFELGEWLEDDALSLPPGALRVCFSESHDTRDINPMADALRGSRLSRLLLSAMVVCGYLPMLWHGQEQGQEQFVRRLLALRRRVPTLRSGETLYNRAPCDVPQVFTVLRHLGSEWLFGVFNMGPNRRIATLSLPVDMMSLDGEAYHLRELIADEILAMPQPTWRRDELLQLPLTVEPYGFCIFSLIPGPAPEPGPGLRPPHALKAPRGRGRREGRVFDVRRRLQPATPVDEARPDLVEAAALDVAEAQQAPEDVAVALGADLGSQPEEAQPASEDVTVALGADLGSQLEDAALPVSAEAEPQPEDEPVAVSASEVPALERQAAPAGKRAKRTRQSM